jgi:hypothetical protein
MKKVLVVLLILAVAGGLFAQTELTFGAGISTGLGIGWDNSDNGDPKIDFVRERGNGAIRGDVSANLRNGKDWEAGTFGGTVTFAVAYGGVFQGNKRAYSVDNVYIFWYPISILSLRIGTHGPWDFGTPGGLGESWGVRGGDAGLSVVLRPIAGLDIMASAMYGESVKLLKDMGYGLGAQYGSDLFSLTANLRYYTTNTKEAGKINAAAGFNFKGLSGLGLTTLAADVGAWGIDGDSAYVGIGEKVEFKALANALTLTVSGQQFFPIADLGSFIPMMYTGDVKYNVNSTVTAGLEARYKMGAGPDDNYRQATQIGGVGGTGNFADDNKKAAFGISPYLTFNVGPKITLGYNFKMDLSDGATAGEKWTSKNLAYVQFEIKK